MAVSRGGPRAVASARSRHGRSARSCRGGPASSGAPPGTRQGGDAHGISAPVPGVSGRRAPYGTSAVTRTDWSPLDAPHALVARPARLEQRGELDDAAPFPPPMSTIRQIHCGADLLWTGIVAAQQHVDHHDTGAEAAARAVFRRILTTVSSSMYTLVLVAR